MFNTELGPVELSFRGAYSPNVSLVLRVAMSQNLNRPRPLQMTQTFEYSRCLFISLVFTKVLTIAKAFLEYVGFVLG